MQLVADPSTSISIIVPSDLHVIQGSDLLRLFASLPVTSKLSLCIDAGTCGPLLGLHPVPFALPQITTSVLEIPKAQPRTIAPAKLVTLPGFVIHDDTHVGEHPRLNCAVVEINATNSPLSVAYDIATKQDDVMPAHGLFTHCFVRFRNLHSRPVIVSLLMLQLMAHLQF